MKQCDCEVCRVVRGLPEEQKIAYNLNLKLPVKSILRISEELCLTEEQRQNMRAALYRLLKGNFCQKAVDKYTKGWNISDEVPHT